MPSTLYGNPRIHKTVINNILKLQTILPAINTHTYLLAKYLNAILSPLTTNEYAAENYFDFAEDVVKYNHKSLNL